MRATVAQPCAQTHAAGLPRTVVRGRDESTTGVGAFDPESLLSLTNHDVSGGPETTLRAADARQRLTTSSAAREGN
jgi:hypothetical protein